MRRAAIVFLMLAALLTTPALSASKNLGATVSFDVTAGTVYKATFTTFSTFLPPSGIVAFTPLHTYFIAASGCSNANAGTSAGSPKCAPTAFSSIVCGDVVIAAAGAYTQANLAITQNPATCPSTTGGIDGAGGVYAAVVLCGSTLGACTVTGGNTSSDRAIQIGANNWSIQGWVCNSPGGTDGTCFSSDCTTSGTNPWHNISFINDIAYATGTGFNLGVCTGGTAASFDYGSVVGSLAQNANQSSSCTSGINFVTPRNLDTNAGTHLFAYGNYVLANGGNSSCGSDGNGMILDSPDILSYTGQVVYSNNIVFKSRQYGIHIFSQEQSGVAPVVKVKNNTTYGNGNPTITSSTTVSEITQYNSLFQQITQNNIAETDAASRAAANLYAFQISVVSGAANTVSTIGGTGNENIFKGTATGCNGSSCAGGSFANIAVSFTTQGLGTNTYIDPAFTNVTDLATNWTGAPTYCNGFENVAQCMGYDAFSNTLTTATVISDLTPTAGGTSAKGFQKPSLTCNSNSDYPASLKGLVYLHWTGSAVQQKQGLATTPCGL